MRRIIDSCILCGKGEYKLKKEKYISKDLTKRLDKYIKSSTSKIIPVTTLFHVFENDLQNEGVDNRYYLQGILHENIGIRIHLGGIICSKTAQILHSMLS